MSTRLSRYFVASSFSLPLSLSPSSLSLSLCPLLLNLFPLQRQYKTRDFFFEDEGGTQDYMGLLPFPQFTLVGKCLLDWLLGEKFLEGGVNPWFLLYY